MIFTESIETYLKEIYSLSQINVCVLAIDIAHRLSVSKASVNRAVKILSKEKYISHKKYGHIYLTVSGKQKAQELCRRQEIIAIHLINTLRIDKKTAFDEACKLEHVISPMIVAKMRTMIDGKRKVD